MCEADVAFITQQTEDREIKFYFAKYEAAIGPWAEWIAASTESHVQRLLMVMWHTPRTPDFHGPRREEWQTRLNRVTTGVKDVLFGSSCPSYMDVSSPRSERWATGSDHFAKWLFAKIPEEKVTRIRTSRLGGSHRAIQISSGFYSSDSDHSSPRVVKCLLPDGRTAVKVGSHTRLYGLSEPQLMSVEVMIGALSHLDVTSLFLPGPPPSLVELIQSTWKR
jgi:hypothetical protein